jgi:hypothetical protein
MAIAGSDLNISAPGGGKLYAPSSYSQMMDEMAIASFESI